MIVKYHGAHPLTHKATALTLLTFILYEVFPSRCRDPDQQRQNGGWINGGTFVNERASKFGDSFVRLVHPSGSLPSCRGPSGVGSTGKVSKQALAPPQPPTAHQPLHTSSASLWMAPATTTEHTKDVLWSWQWPWPVLPGRGP